MCAHSRSSVLRCDIGEWVYKGRWRDIECGWVCGCRWWGRVRMTNNISWTSTYLCSCSLSGGKLWENLTLGGLVYWEIQGNICHWKVRFYLIINRKDASNQHHSKTKLMLSLWFAARSLKRHRCEALWPCLTSAMCTNSCPLIGWNLGQI